MTAKTLVLDDDDFEHIMNEAVDVLRAGGLVVYPTDTCYGIGCDVRQEDAFNKLLAAKKRDPKVGMPMLFSDVSQTSSFYKLQGLEIIIARMFWPGALTIIVPVKDNVPEHLTGGRNSLAIRVPNHVVPRGIAKKFDYPVVGTSANLTGGPTPFDVRTAKEQLGDKVDLYIDGGGSSSTNSSTLITVIKGENGISSIKVFREGAIKIDDITERLRVDTDAQRFWTSRVIFAEM
ncbi:MAG: L-threonylcarbamoyladenylate synthase [Candidatus Thorarchaeota archaeon]